jgi:hypothetical protein
VILFLKIVRLIVEFTASESMAKEVESFFASHPAPSAERTVQQVKSMIRRAMFKKNITN